MDARTNPMTPDYDYDPTLDEDTAALQDQAQAEMIATDEEIIAGPEIPQEDANDPNAIKGDIAQTRAAMSQTIDAIQERLAPRHLVAQAKDQIKEATIGKVQTMANTVRDSAADAGYTIMDTVRQNPLPSIMAGVGLSWLLYRSMSMGPARRPRRGMYRTQPYDYGYGYNYDPYTGKHIASSQRGTQSYATESASSPSLGDRASQATGKIRDKASDMANTVQDKVGDLADTVQDRASDLGDTMQQQAGQARDWLQDAWNDNPLIFTAGAAIVGLGLGLLIKESEQENRMMGPARDQMAQQAQNAAQDTAQKVQHVAQRATDAAKDEAKQQGLIGQQTNANQSQSSASR
jgi:ElaB/YqjD/DUF883 family membrane-anchored ribosome-binding protein